MHMTFGENLLVALFIIFLVFLVLVAIYVLIQLFSKILGSMKSSDSQSNQVTETVVQPAADTIAPVEVSTGPELSTGELFLKNVDEKTAAMIMAIVSDESSIPLSELRFKSIKLIEKEL